MYTVFERLCREKGVTAYKVAKDIGFRTAVFSNWKAGRYTPKMDKLQKIADYFGVPLSYLTTGEMEELESDSGKKYYFSDDAAAAAQEIYSSPALRALFDAARGKSDEDILAVAGVLERLKATNPEG